MPRTKVQPEVTEQADQTEEAKPNESKAEKFTRLAKGRVENALYQINNLGKLATSAYEYTPDQATKMFNAIRAAADEAEAKFKTKEPKGKPTFTF